MSEFISSYWELVEPVFDKVDIDTLEKFSSSIANVPRPVLFLYATHFCLSEIHNGGLLQFFWNSTGVMAPESAEGFNVIGMPKLAALVTAAAAPLGRPYPRDRDKRWDSLLVASDLSEQDLKKIFEGTSNLYLAFREATTSLSFDELDRQAWELAETENGGFQEAATRYAQTVNLVG